MGRRELGKLQEVFKKSVDPPHILMDQTGEFLTELRVFILVGQKVGEAICMARDLINDPSNELHPEALAEACKTDNGSASVVARAIAHGASWGRGATVG
jgi:leucyl aminopeptidase